MTKIKVYFADGSTRVFHDQQKFMAVNFADRKTNVFTFDYDINHGLIKTFLEALSKSDYFYVIDRDKTYYNAKAIVKIEELL